MMKFLRILTLSAATAMLSAPALATDFIGKSNIDFFYAELEGGYGLFSGPDDTAGAVSLSPNGGGYGTFTLGHVSIDNGIIYGYVDRAELWVTYADHGDDSFTTYSNERNYWEIGTRFQHYFDQNATDKTMWGFEPFIGFVDGSFANPGMGAAFSYDATIYGAMLSFEAERHLSPSTMVHFRAAGGAYFGDMDVSGSGTASNDFSGFRGQLAAGVNHNISDRFSVGAVARLDYFSDAAALVASPVAASTDSELGAYFGVNMNYIFAGIYQ